MAVGKPLKKNFYSNGETNDIEMPPLNQTTPIASAAPDPWAQPQPQEQSAAASVPDSVPQDVLDEMNRTQNVDSSVEDNQSAARDESSQTEEDEEFDPENDPEVQDAVRNARKHKESQAQARIRALREAQKKAESERDELLRMMQMQQMQQNLPMQQAPAEPEQDFDLEDDALVEGKYIRQMNKKMKAMEQQLNSYHHQTAQSITEAKVRSAYPDFDQVVSPENLEIFKERYPELANTVGTSQDFYSQCVSAYTLIKQFGIHKSQAIENDRLKVLKNSAKPRPLASVNPQQGDSPLSKANAFANGEFTDEIKEQLRREMLQARRNM